MKRSASIRGSYLSALVVATALFSLSGCTPELVFEKKFSTEHFDYYLDETLEFRGCDDTKIWLERYYAGISKFLGVSLPAGEKIQYHVVWTSYDPRLECSLGIPCANGTNTYTSQYVGRHEIVRATASLLGNPPLFFQQGLAEVLGCGYTSDVPGPIEKIWGEYLVVSSSYASRVASGEEDVQSTAGSFVRHLIDTYGKEKFLSFYAHAPRNGSKAEIDAVFEQEFGSTLHDEFAKWIRLPARVPGDVCLRVMECDAEMPELTNGDVELGCGPSGYGSFSREGIFRFQIDNDRSKQIITEPLVTDPQLYSMVNFFRCDGGSALVASTPTADFIVDGAPATLTVNPERNTRRFVFDAPAGEYFARFYGEGDASIHAEMLDAPSPMRDTCMPAAEPLLMADNETIVLSSRWMDRPCTGFYCPGYGWDVEIGPNGGAIEFYPWTTEGRVLFSPTKIYLCTDPCPTGTERCEMLEFDPEASPKLVQSNQVFAPGTVVHVGAPLAPYYEHFSVHMRVVPQ
jgi:hypothetical protein